MKDFFISYASSDEKYAKWIAELLEKKTAIQLLYKHGTFDQAIILYAKSMKPSLVVKR